MVGLGQPPRPSHPAKAARRRLATGGDNRQRPNRHHSGVVATLPAPSGPAPRRRLVSIPTRLLRADFPAMAANKINAAFSDWRLRRCWPRRSKAGHRSADRPLRRESGGSAASPGLVDGPGRGSPVCPDRADRRPRWAGINLPAGCVRKLAGPRRARFTVPAAGPPPRAGTWTGWSISGGFPWRRCCIGARQPQRSGSTPLAGGTRYRHAGGRDALTVDREDHGLGPGPVRPRAAARVRRPH